jgi:hypothetical protein
MTKENAFGFPHGEGGHAMLQTNWVMNKECESEIF